MFGNKKTSPSGETTGPAEDLAQVVETYAARADAAADLAEVDTRHLDTPTANPAAVATLNAERDRAARERITLDYERERVRDRDEHDQLLEQIAQRRHYATAVGERSSRAVSEGLADADEASAQLATIREFEAEASPAAASTWLTRAARGWRREEFAYALVGSVLSAMGIAALVMVAGLPWWGAAVVAAGVETVLTVRVIRLIGQRAALAERHKGRQLSEAGRRADGFLRWQIIGLLAASVLVNAVGLFAATGVLGLLGVLGAVGAAVASWSAAQVSVAVTETVRSNVSSWQGEHWAAERAGLAERAAGTHIPTPESPASPGAGTAAGPGLEQAVRAALEQLSEERLAALAEQGTDALAVMLAHRGGGGTPAAGGGGTGGGTPLEPGAEPAREQQVEAEPVDNRERVLRAICDPVHGLGASAQNAEIARELNLSRTAVRNHRKALAAEGHQVFAPVKTTDQ